MITQEVWNLLLGAVLGSLVTTAAGAWQLAGIKAELAAVRRDVDRLLNRET